MHQFRLHQHLNDDLADRLEAHFCEITPSPWMLVQVRSVDPYYLAGYFSDRCEGDTAWAEVAEAFPELTGSVEWTEIEDADWKEAYKLHFQPWAERGLHWVPEWLRETYTVPTGETAVYVDPGMAFGTGDHPTTRLMALTLLDSVDLWGASIADRTCIDAGCGSGILSISARKLGYGTVIGFDHDPEAARVSRENLIANDLSADAVTITAESVEEGVANRTADLILANIQANILSIYAENLLGAIKPGGILALSGILADELDAFAATFEAKRIESGHPLAVASIEKAIEGEWSRLVYTFAAG